MIKGSRKFDENTTNRKTHQEDVEGIVAIIAKKKGISEKIVGIMAKNHDIGHTFMGHSGEWWISNVLENNGLGVVCHNAMGAKKLIYRHNIYNEILEKIKLFYPNISKRELNKVEESLWLIMDAINAHNGEKCSQQFIPKVLKNEKEFEDELIKCFTIKGFDRTIEPASTEACLMRLADQISYVPSDMADGLREGFIEGLDEEYAIELEKIGITRQEIKEYIVMGKYNDLAKRVRDIFSKDLDENSTKKKIAMSDKVFQVMKNIKKINDKQIVDWVLPDLDIEIYPKSVEILIDKYVQTILQNGLLNNIGTSTIDIQYVEECRRKYKGTQYIGLVEYLVNTPEKDYEFTKKTIKHAILESVRIEQEEARRIVLESSEFVKEEGFEKKDARISEYISHYNEQVKENGYGEEKKQDILAVVQENGKHYLSMKECIAMKMAGDYLATLSDREFMQQLLDMGIIGLDEKDKLTVKYKNIDIHKKTKTDENWEKIRKLFDEAEPEEEFK